jgi:hypothetical protein
MFSRRLGLNTLVRLGRFYILSKQIRGEEINNTRKRERINKSESVCLDIIGDALPPGITSRSYSILYP